MARKKKRESGIADYSAPPDFTGADGFREYVGKLSRPFHDRFGSEVHENEGAGPGAGNIGKPKKKNRKKRQRGEIRARLSGSCMDWLDLFSDKADISMTEMLRQIIQALASSTLYRYKSRRNKDKGIVNVTFKIDTKTGEIKNDSDFIEHPRP